MIYPEFPKKEQKIGIIAPSAGMDANDEESYALSFENLKTAGYELSFGALSGKPLAKDAPDVYVSASGKERADELHSALINDDIGYIVCQSGGDFLVDMLPYVDCNIARAHPKWVQGYSDPTGLLYLLTTKCDIATVYGANAGGFDMKELHGSLKYALSFISGRCRAQHSFERFEASRDARTDGYALSAPVYWNSLGKELNAHGRLIGGCMDCLSDVFGSPFDGGADFVRRYADDGIIWYFDVFAMKAEQVHNFLAKMKASGYFENTRAYIFGRVLFGGSYIGMSYEDAVMRALGKDAPVVFDADIGHVKPTVTLVNGAIAEIKVKEGKASLELIFK